MRRTESSNALLPVSALLLACLMIASLVGIQGAMDRALNFSLAGQVLPALGLRSSSMNPILTPRQPAQRTVERLAAVEVAVESTPIEISGASTQIAVVTEPGIIALLLPAIDNSGQPTPPRASKGHSLRKSTPHHAVLGRNSLKPPSMSAGKGGSSKMSHPGSHPGQSSHDSKGKDGVTSPQAGKAKKLSK